MSARILVVDDEPDIRSLLKDILEDEGYIVDIAEHARAANEIRQSTKPDLVLLDIWMPEIDGVTLLKEWKSSASDHCPVVMMSGHGTVETAVEATRFGAYDFVEKPLSMAKLLSTVKAALSSTEQSSQQDLRSKGEEPVGTSQIVRRLKQKIHALSDSNTALFFTGANGSGRRIWALYLSELSHPGVAMQLMDTITGISHFMPLRANLYVEEIADLDKDQQLRLCDAIQHENSDSNYRFILSSRFDYSELANNRQILSTLADFWKEAIRIPSLDEHVEDIPELLEYYVNWYSELEQLPYRHFGVAAQNLLRNHHWGGEISQLKRFVKTVLSHSDSETIELDEIRRLLLKSDRSYQSGNGNTIQLTVDLDMDLREAREAFERAFLSKQLALSGNNITELAKRVGQERTNLYRKLKTLGLHNKKRS
jgi:DNA-binding NtrC family response regulator